MVWLGKSSSWPDKLNGEGKRANGEMALSTLLSPNGKCSMFASITVVVVVELLAHWREGGRGRLLLTVGCWLVGGSDWIVGIRAILSLLRSKPQLAKLYNIKGRRVVALTRRAQAPEGGATMRGSDKQGQASGCG